MGPCSRYVPDGMAIPWKRGHFPLADSGNFGRPSENLDFRSFAVGGAACLFHPAGLRTGRGPRPPVAGESDALRSCSSGVCGLLAMMAGGGRPGTLLPYRGNGPVVAARPGALVLFPCPVERRRPGPGRRGAGGLAAGPGRPRTVMARLVIKGPDSKSRLWLARRTAEQLAAALHGLPPACPDRQARPVRACGPLVLVDQPAEDPPASYPRRRQVGDRGRDAIIVVWWPGRESVPSQARDPASPATITADILAGQLPMPGFGT
jgi:hypothetical protein